MGPLTEHCGTAAPRQNVSGPTGHLQRSALDGTMGSPPQEPSWLHFLFGKSSSGVTPPSRPKTHQVMPGASAALTCADCGDEIRGTILMFMDRPYCCQRHRYHATERAERDSRVERRRRNVPSPELQLSEGGDWRSNRWI